MCDNSNEVEIAWAAGIFEGEGCISIHQQQKSKYPSISLVVVMTDGDVVRRFAGIMGVGKLSTKSPSNLGYKLGYKWKISKRTEVERILNLFLPYLGERRSLIAKEALCAPSSGRRWGEGPRAGESAKYRSKGRL